MKVKGMENYMPPYTGGKSGNGTYQNIINHIPPHKIYVAPFAGHDGIFRKIKRADISILNDKDPSVIERWKALNMKDCIVTENYFQGTLFERSNKPMVILRNQDAAGIIAKFADTSEAFIYLDPPYRIGTRRGGNKKLYLFEWQDDAFHVNLLKQIVTIKTNVMISAYENDLYNEHLKGWNTHRFKSMTRAGLREETIYFNYPPPTVLHDYRYLGANFRERERIKRKVVRHINKLQNLPAIERTAILSSIINGHLSTVKSIINL